MKQTDRWLLPEGIEEVLPEKACRLETLRRQLLDMYASWGYDMVMPPFIEYLESLLTGTGHDLELQTFKLTDQLTGRMMGVRADMTPQVARIDAHQLKHDTPTRLCYMGTVLHTRSDGFAGSRSPLQIGAELYGHSGVESDLEVLSLMVETLQLSGISNITLDLGHVGIYRALVKQAGLSTEQEAELFDALQRKAAVEIKQMLDDADLEQPVHDMLGALIQLNGGDDILAEAQNSLKAAGDSVAAAIQTLRTLGQAIKARYPAVNLHFDLAELRGYNYHTGVVFSAYTQGQGQSIAQGGRYDDIGQVFGRARPATGFSTDLKNLVESFMLDDSKAAIFAPADNDEALLTKIRSLREQGERVICALPDQQGDAGAMGCDRELIRSGDTWQVKAL